MGHGVHELRLSCGPGYRIYYAQRGTAIVLLLYGGGKSSQADDIDKAHRLAAEWYEQEDSHES